MDESQISQLETDGHITPAQASAMRQRLRGDSFGGNLDPTQGSALPPAASPQVVDAAPAPAFQGTPSVYKLPMEGAPSGASASWAPDVTPPTPNFAPPTNATAQSDGAIPAADHRQAPGGAPTPAAGTGTLETDKVVTTKDDPATAKKLKETQEKIDIGFQKAADAEAAHNDALKLESTARAVEYGKYLDQEQLKQADEQRAIEQKHQDYQTEMDKYQNEKLDSGRWFADSSTGSKIMAGIAVGLGAMGQAYGGGDNPAVAIIDKAIDRDIAQQKFNIDQHGKVVEGKRTLYTDLVKKFGDERAARAAYQEVVFKKLANESDARAATSNSDVIKANGALQAAQFRGKSDEAAAARNNIVTTTVKKEAAAGALKPTAGQTMSDSEFAKDYNAWNTSGAGLVDKNLDKLREAKALLEKRKGDLVGTSGRLTGRLPDALRSEESIAIRDKVQTAAQGALKATLGAQFTEKEGQRIMNQAFNEKLSPQENINRIDAAIVELENNKQRMANRAGYFEKHGTLTGWSSPK